MDTAHLKAFLRIAECGSISRAAESLGIAQPSLSQQLLRLEDEVGFSLFERSARGVVLTQAGHVFRERARELLHAADQAIADARQLRNELRGQVVFAMPPSVAGLVGARLIEALHEQSPTASLRIVEAYHGAIWGWLEAGKIDLGLLYDLHAFPHLAVRRLFREELFLIGPPGQFGTFERPLTLDLADVADHPLVLPGPQHGMRQLLEKEAGRQGAGLKVRHEADSLDVALDLVERGVVCTVLPMSTITKRRADRFSVARLGQSGTHRAMAIARNPSLVLSHASVRIEMLMRDVLAQMASEGSWRGELLQD